MNCQAKNSFRLRDGIHGQEGLLRCGGMLAFSIGMGGNIMFKNLHADSKAHIHGDRRFVRFSR
jgi:hypothetical protein